MIIHSFCIQYTPSKKWNKIQYLSEVAWSKISKRNKTNFFPQLYIASFNRRGKQIWIYENEIYFIPHSFFFAHIAGSKQKYWNENENKIVQMSLKSFSKIAWAVVEFIYRKKMLQSSLDGFRQRYFICILYSHSVATCSWFYLVIKLHFVTAARH